jgi:hypothetical protein
MTEPLLSVRNLIVDFRLDDGAVLPAVNRVRFVNRAPTLALA